MAEWLAFTIRVQEGGLFKSSYKNLPTNSLATYSQFSFLVKGSGGSYCSQNYTLLFLGIGLSSMAAVEEQIHTQDPGCSLLRGCGVMGTRVVSTTRLKLPADLCSAIRSL